jgi:thiol:disulfide interchange protein DsbD
MALVSLWFAAAFASEGTASAPPPPPPTVDLSTVAPPAFQRKIMADGKPHPVEARLLADRAPVAPGSTVRVGLHLTQDAGWHTYWKSPGDIGLPTEITWTLPEGVTVAPHVYPVPQRFEQDGQVSFGYENQVLLVSDMVVPASLPPGTYTVAASANWLVCKTTCIPGDAELEMTLEVAARAPLTPTAYAPLFDHYAAQHPAPPETLAQLVTWTLELPNGAVHPNETFKAAFLLEPAPGVSLVAPSVGGPAWPTFTPIVSSFDWAVTSTTVKLGDDGRIRVELEGETFEPDPLPTEPQAIGGLVQIQVKEGGWVRSEISAPLPWLPTGGVAAAAVPVAAATAVAAGPPAASGGAMGLIGNLLLAFVGGLILNIMPCVLPVLTLKLYSLVEQADVGAAKRRVAGVAYTAGIVASFWALALVIVGLRLVLDVNVDWGFQFQYPPYVAGLATVVFAFGLSLLGVFEIPALGADAAGEASSRDGLVGYFLTGVFATLLATPCSAPFLGSAVAYAFGAPPITLIAIFSMVALGLAFPFLLIAFVPVLFRFLPRPGEWMDVVKQALGFTLLATTIWLVDVLVAQIGADQGAWFLGFLLTVGMACWIFGRFGGVAATGRRQLAAATAGLAVATFGGVSMLDLTLAPPDAVCDDGSVLSDLSFEEEVPWQTFTEPRVAALSGKPVFVDFTADWCLTCKVNESTILETDKVRGAMEEHGIVPLKADWTRRDPVITDWLHRHGRAGVPMYLVLPCEVGREPILLPEVITPSMVVAALEQAC